jgi:hypothetical protein
MTALIALLAFLGSLLSGSTPPASSGGGISYNWAGYVQPDGFYTSAGAEWTVPPLVCPPSGVTEVAYWVGVDGWGALPDIFQTGTVSRCLNGVQTNWAWWTDEYEGDVAQPVFAVATGDVIYARVWQRASGYWSYRVRDVTTGVSNTAVVASAWGRGVTAEVIAEDPANMAVNKPFTLADFGTVTFSHVTPLLQGAQAIAMVPPDGVPLAMPSDVEGAGFEVAS